jgi:hypothetical protein
MFKRTFYTKLREIIHLTDTAISNFAWNSRKIFDPIPEVVKAFLTAWNHSTIKINKPEIIDYLYWYKIRLN